MGYKQYVRNVIMKWQEKATTTERKTEETLTVFLSVIRKIKIMPKYKKKPVVVDVVGQFDGTHLLQGMDFDMSGAFVRTMHENQKVYVLEGDWILPEPDGEHYYPVKDEVFKNTYELCE